MKNFGRFKNTLMITGPRNDSCGTPNFEYKKFEPCESICIKWFLFGK